MNSMKRSGALLVDSARVAHPVASPARAAAGRRIKVLHSVGHLLRGGIETWLYQMVTRLDPTRFEHHVLVWTDEEQAFTADFQAAGVRVLPCLGHTNPLRFAANFRRLVAENGPYDILHTHGTHYHGFVMMLAARAGIPARIAHSHTDIKPVLAEASLPYRLYAGLGHAAIRHWATAGRGVSGLAAASMFKAGWRQDPRFDVLYCGVDLEPFAAAPDLDLRRRLGMPEDSMVVGHVGRFEKQKNHGFLLETAAAVRQLEPKAHFLLIGDGSQHAEYVARTEALGLTPHVTFIRDCRTIPAHMIGAMDRFLFPSLYEGLPLVTVEAQAAGLPCLISDSLTREILVEGTSSRMMPLSAGPEAWAQALLALPARTPESMAEMRRILERGPFNIRSAARSLANVYEQSVERSSR